MIFLQEDKKIASLLPPNEARQVLLALFSELDDLPEMTPLAYMAYTAIKGRRDRISKVKSKAGKTGGAPKGNQNALKQPKQAETNAVQSKQPKQTETNIVQSKQVLAVAETNAHYTVPDADRHGDEEGGAGLQERRFVEFWAAYPRKVGKEAARKAWRHIKPTAALQSKILSAIEQAKGSGQWQCDNGRYIPNPTTWLNQGRWDDEIQPYSAKSANRISSIKCNFTQRSYCDEELEQFVTNDFGKG